MVDRKIAKRLHFPTRPANRRSRLALDLAQSKEYFLSVLGKESRSGLKHASLSSRFGFQRHQSADRITITLSTAKSKGDGRVQLLHHVLQKSQLRGIAVF